MSTIHPPFLAYSIVHEYIKLSKLACNACFIIWEAAAVTDLLNLSWQWLEVATLTTTWSLGRDSPSSLLSSPHPTSHYLSSVFAHAHVCSCVTVAAHVPRMYRKLAKCKSYLSVRKPLLPSWFLLNFFGFEQVSWVEVILCGGASRPAFKFQCEFLSWIPSVK